MYGENFFEGFFVWLKVPACLGPGVIFHDPCGELGNPKWVKKFLNFFFVTTIPLDQGIVSSNFDLHIFFYIFKHVNETTNI